MLNVCKITNLKQYIVILTINKYFLLNLYINKIMTTYSQISSSTVYKSYQIKNYITNSNLFKIIIIYQKIVEQIFQKLKATALQPPLSIKRKIYINDKKNTGSTAELLQAKLIELKKIYIKKYTY